jgi:hypothetical protein
MPPNQYMQEMKQAEESNFFLAEMSIRRKDVSDMYGAVLGKYAKLATDEDLVNTLISEMIVVTCNLIIKLESGNDTAKQLLKDFDEFTPWLDDISLPKRDLAEAKKIHKLYRLILKAYDLLGLSNF